MSHICTRPHAIVLCGRDEIGIRTAQALDKAGLHVFAAVRSADHGRRLKHLSPQMGVHVFEAADLSDDLAALARAVRGHVSNRGVDLVVTETVERRPYPLEFASKGLFEQHWRQHVLGAVLAGQTFMELLREGRGRLVVMGTIGGGLTLPFSSVLSSSGHALRALADAWRQEVYAWKVDVVLVEIAGVRNDDGFENFAKEAMDTGPTRMKVMYGRSYTGIMGKAIRQEVDAMSPVDAAAAIQTIALKRRTKSRYVVGNRGRLLGFMGSLPAPVQDGLKRRLLK